MNPKLQVWSCGGGTQSCAIAALIIQGKLPKPDVCVISNTKRETGATWDYLRDFVNPALSSVGLEVLIIDADVWSYHGTRIRYSNTTVAIPAYSTLNSGVGGEPAKMRNFCTRNWKVDAIVRWLSETLGITRSKTRMWIGFSRDEQLRVCKVMAGEEYQKGLVWLPLVECLPTTRREGMELVKFMGWPDPPRSACWMCPNHSDHEWRRLKEERPAEFQQAITFDRELRVLVEHAWLHRSCVPLDQVDFSQPEDLFSRPCDSGHCFV